MIDDIRSRLARIEARFQPARPLGSDAGVEPAAFRELLLATTASGDAGVTGLLDLLAPTSPWGSATVPIRPMSGAWTAGAAARPPGTGAGAMPARGAAYAPLFDEMGSRYGVEPDLLAAVAWTESGFDPAAVSHAGALGLMQIMPGTAGALGVDPRDPVQAVDGAARYLREQLDRFGDVRLALAAYNAGPGAVQQHGGIPPYPETQQYVEKVLGRVDHLRSRP